MHDVFTIGLGKLMDSYYLLSCNSTSSEKFRKLDETNDRQMIRGKVY